jgi:hypothetical protein
MNYRIALILLIAFVTAGFAWRDAQRLSELNERHRAARIEARRLGIATRPAEVVSRLSKHPRISKAPNDKQAVAHAIASIENFEAARKVPGDTNEKSTERFGKLLEVFDTLTAPQVRMLISEIRSHGEFGPITRESHERHAITSLINRSPGEGLDVYVDTQDQSREQGSGSRVECTLNTWAAKDSTAALDWIRRNLEKHPESISDASKSCVIGRIATTDRKQAFNLIAELGVRTPSDATTIILASAKTAEERIAAIADLREYLPTIQDKNERFEAGDYAIARIGSELARDGFQAATQWAESAGLTDTELSSFGSAFGSSVQSGEYGKWAEWYGKHLPNGYCTRPIRQLMENWTREDYKAAGTWLNGVPAGNMKWQAISTFACEVSHYEPEAAVQWAVTLPACRARDEVFHKIYHNWPRKDPAGEAAAAAFEKQYQIKHDH